MRRVFVSLVFGLALLAGPAFADFDTGFDAYLDDDYVVAEKHLLPLAEKGNAEAQYFLGHMYNYGADGFPKSREKGVQWYKKASDQGHAGAQASLGMLYSWGGGVPVDYDKAFSLANKAAKQGNNLGQYLLGELYFDGQGTEKNYDLSVKWYLKAAGEGSPRTHFKLGRVYLEGKNDLVSAYKWLVVADLRGFDEAEEALYKARNQMTWEQIQEGSSHAAAWLKAHQ